MLPDAKLDILLARHATLEAELLGQVNAETYVRATRELRACLIRELDVRFVNKRRRAEGMSRALESKLAMCDPPQLIVEQGKEGFRCSDVAVLRSVRRVGHPLTVCARVDRRTRRR